MHSLLTSLFLLAVIQILTACGNNTTSTDPGATTYTVGGTISGLTSAQSVEIINNGGDNLVIGTNGSFTFATEVADGTTYDVQIATQPATQTCTVSANTGTVNSAAVSGVTISCLTNTFNVGGNLSGLGSSQSVTISNNGSDNLTLNANGAFTFSTPIADATTYDVQVVTQPATQTCTASANTGTINSSAVSNTVISCSDNTYTVGGNLSGLGSGLSVTLTNNGADNLVLNASGPFTFSTSVADGAGYNVQVAAQPTGQACVLSDNIGTISSSIVANVNVACSDTIGSGELDTSFNSGGSTPGIVASDLGINSSGDDEGNAIAVDSLDRIVVAGHAYIDDTRLDDMTVWRFLDNGTPDTNFDGDGALSLHNALGHGDDSKEFGEAMVIDGSGRIVVAGQATENPGPFFVDMVIWRIDATGSLDSNFNGSGIVSHGNAAGGGLNDIAYAVTLDNSGRILACGESSNNNDKDAVVWRYNDNGTLDTANFNSPNGFRVFDNIGGGSLNDICQGIIVDSSDRILFTGETDTATGLNMFVMRLLDDGTPDTNFDTDGIALDTAAFSSGHDIKLKVDGDILIGGRINSATDFGVWRYDTNGGLDSNFNSGSSNPGINITGISTTSNTADLGFSLATDSSSRIYLTGFNQNLTTSTDMVLIRLTGSGELDTSFNPAATTPPPGIVTFHNSAGGNSGDQAYGIALDGDEKILVTGTSNSANSADMTIWKINP